jgi:hypothetical protein
MNSLPSKQMLVSARIARPTLAAGQVADLAELSTTPAQVINPTQLQVPDSEQFHKADYLL